MMGNSSKFYFNIGFQTEINKSQIQLIKFMSYMTIVFILIASLSNVFMIDISNDILYFFFVFVLVFVLLFLFVQYRSLEARLDDISNFSGLFSKYVFINYAFITSIPLMFVIMTYILKGNFAFASNILFSLEIVLFYVTLIVTTTFAYSPRLSFFVSLLIALEYNLIYWLIYYFVDVPTLMHNGFFQINLLLKFNIFIMFLGMFVGAIADTTRKFALHVISTIIEKDHLSDSFGQYVSPQVRDKILSKGVNTEGEDKWITVLFTDIRNFTTFSENKNPSEVVKYLNEYFQAMVKIIQLNGGVVDKFVGDAIMAYFESNSQSSNILAVNASLKMIEALEEFNRQYSKSSFKGFDFGIGLHYGRVIMGNIGSHDRKNYTIIGDTVNTASRIESLTRKNDAKLIISENVYKDLTGSLSKRFSPIPLTLVKGKTKEIQCYKLG